MPLTIMNSPASIRMWLGAMVTIWTFHGHFIQDWIPHLKEAQRELYKTAYEQVSHNMGILRPGLTFREYADLAWEIPDKYYANRYYLSAHGCTMTGECPYLHHRGDFPDAGYDGVMEPGVVICVESVLAKKVAFKG